MAKERIVNTRFWNDGFISQLDPIEKLLFVYFLTNEHTNICGIYELPLKIAAVETGIDPSMFEKIFPRLEEKIIYIEGWVIIKNFSKYQHGDNPKIKIGIERELSLIPSHIIEKAIPYGYPIHSPSYFNSNSNSNTWRVSRAAHGSNSDERLRGEESVPSLSPEGKEPAAPLSLASREEDMTALIGWAEKMRDKKFMSLGKQKKAISQMFSNGYSAKKIGERWLELSNSDSEAFKKTGIDFMTILNSFDRKP